MLAKYGKSVIAFGYAVAFVVIPQISGDGHLDPTEGVTVAIAVVTAAGVYLIPLAPTAKWTKTAVGVLLAALNVAATVILDYRIDAEEWLMIVTAAIAAAGIAIAPAASPKTGTGVTWGSDT